MSIGTIGIESADVFEAGYERVVRDDIEEFRAKAEEFLAGTITDDQFRPFRLRRGIYGQRQPGVQMVRTKIPGGLLTAQQLKQLAGVAEEYSTGRGHLTTRQNIQFHYVPLAEVPKVMHLLADVRLTTREACFNTVRNVTSCTYAGLSPDEAFDVQPYAQRIAFAFLRNQLTDSMPRKFKIGFCGCRRDCTATAINDIGLHAVIRDGQRGFRLALGGGLGSLPHESQLLEEFVPEEHLIQKCEAVIRVFHQYGNRKNKMMARFKFIIRERGFAWVKEAVENEFQTILKGGGIPWPEHVPEGFGGFQSKPQPLGTGAELPLLDEAPDPEYDRWLESNVREQKQPGYSIVVVRVPQGNITGEQMRGIARLAEDTGDGLIRIPIDQNLVLAYMPLARLKQVHSALRQIGLAATGACEIEDVTTCPGAYSCNLGLTKSMNLGEKLGELLSAESDPAVRKLHIKISGCPNSCGQHWIADIGFFGNARKVDGRQIPYYQFVLGGGYDEQGMLRFGLAIQSLPARLAPVAVRRVLDHFQANRQDKETFRSYVLRHKVEFFRNLVRDLAKPAEYEPEIFRDWGDDVDFSLQLGRGECAA